MDLYGIKKPTIFSFQGGAVVLLLGGYRRAHPSIMNLKVRRPFTVPPAFDKTEILGFYEKLLQTISPDQQSQWETIRHALVLFYDFTEKKRTALKRKLDQVNDLCR